jgi:hypothetical protein
MILELLKHVTESLEAKKIPYMLSGSLALNVYSLPRMTLDIDIVVDLYESELLAFYDIFKENFYLNIDTLKEEIRLKGMFNVLDLKTGFKIDFIVKKQTDYRINEFSRRRKVPFENFDAWVVSPEDLIISKIDWIQQLKSDKQIVDIKNLLAIPKLDRNYIVNWCKKLKLNTYDLI